MPKRVNATQAQTKTPEMEGDQSSAEPSSKPLSTIVTTFCGVPLDEPTASTAVTACMPSTTFPKTTCLPSSHAVFTVVIKNCDPFVFGPAFAILRMPGSVFFNLKFASANLSP